MKKILIHLIAFGLFSGILKAQPPDSVDQSFDEFFRHHIVKYEGIPAPLFKAPDLEGYTHYLDYYSGFIVILHFWQVYSEGDILQIQSLNKINKEYFDKGVTVLGFAINDVEDITELLKTQDINYPVIPNSREFASDYYGGELGLPRVFLIDKYGIIQKVTTGASYGNPLELYHRLVPFIEEHLKY